MYRLFTLPGDEYTSERENFHFHKGMKYKVSRVEQHDGEQVVIMFDKYGKEVPINFSGYSDSWSLGSAKLVNQMYQRQAYARSKYLWKSKTLFTAKDPEAKGSGHRYDWEKKFFYEISKAHFLGEGLEGVIASLRRYKLDPTGEGGWKYYYDKEFGVYFKSEEEFHDYFYKTLLGSGKVEINWEFTTLHVNAETQDTIDMLSYLAVNKIPFADPEEVFETRNLWAFRHSEVTDQEYLNHLADLIFDKPKLTLDKEKQLIKDILTLYRELPSSHSATSVSKVLLGKSKVKIAKVAEFEGKYPDFLKQPQLFELASSLQQYMFDKDIFKSKEEYSSGKEWRGAFEYIGSKYIDNDKLQQFIKLI